MPSIAALDREFSKYIRCRDTGTYPMDKNGKFSPTGKFIHGDGGYTECFTCGTIKGYSDLDCSHYVGRQHYATRWNPMNCRAACRYCNRFQEGEKGIFRKKLVELYGEEEISKMEGMRRLGRKPRPWEAVEILARIRKDLAELAGGIAIGLR